MIRSCYSCKEDYSIEHFAKDNGRKGINGFQRECRKCCYHRKTAWNKTEAGQRSAKNTKLKRKYGITLMEYEEMTKAANNQCQICGIEGTRIKPLCVDHCHSTAKIRGLLCSSCNLLIGHSRDSVNIMNKAIIYLNNFGEVTW